MGRLEEIDGLTALIRRIGFTRAEQRVIHGLLVERLTHRQIAAREGLQRRASISRLYRARARARKHGVELPVMRRKIAKAPLSAWRR